MNRSDYTQTICDGCGRDGRGLVNGLCDDCYIQHYGHANFLITPIERPLREKRKGITISGIIPPPYFP